MTDADIRQNGPKIAAEMKAAPAGKLTPDVRRRFIEIRTALFQRGLYDPILVRFDSATAPQASAAEVAGQLEKVVTDF